MSARCYYIILLMLLGMEGMAQRVEGLSCERRSNPEGIDVRRPCLSWRIVGGWKGLRQTAYQVIVASTAEKLAADEGDLWNSGKVKGDRSWLVPYAGAVLKSRMACYWKVKV